MNDRQNLLLTLGLVIALMGTIVFLVSNTLAHDRIVFVSEEREVISFSQFGELVVMHRVPSRYTDQEKLLLYNSLAQWIKSLNMPSLTEIESVYVAYIIGLANEIMDTCDYSVN